MLTWIDWSRQFLGMKVEFLSKKIMKTSYYLLCSW